MIGSRPLPVSRRLPDFPWDHLTAYGDRARAHPGGIVDLSIGTPVDPTPEVVQAALRDALVERDGRFAFDWNPWPLGLVTWEPSAAPVPDA